MLASLTPFDIVVILLIGLGGIAGLLRGFVTEVLSLLAWVAGIVAVRFLYAPGRDLARGWLHNDAGAALLAFVVIFVTAYIAFRFVAQMLGTRTRASIVGPLDRLLGLGFGAFKGLIGAAILFLLLTYGLDVLDKGGPRPAWLQAGRTEPLLQMTSKALVDFVDKTRAGQPIGKSLGEAVLPADKSIVAPADKPADKPVARPDAGYRPTDRNALDKLLDRAGIGGTNAPTPVAPTKAPEAPAKAPPSAPDKATTTKI